MDTRKNIVVFFLGGGGVEDYWVSLRTNVAIKDVWIGKGFHIRMRSARVRLKVADLSQESTRSFLNTKKLGHKEGSYSNAHP